MIEIRKNEREYLNRNDSVYAKQVVVLTNNLINSISNNKYIPTKEKRQLKAHLTNYLLSFNKLTSLDKKLGLKANNGFKTSLYTKGEILEDLISKSISEAKDFENTQIARLNLLFALLSVFLIICAAGLSLYLSRYLLNHLVQLTNYISQLSKSNFNYDAKLNLRKSSTEIREIYKEFRNMVSRLI